MPGHRHHHGVDPILYDLETQRCKDIPHRVRMIVLSAQHLQIMILQRDLYFVLRVWIDVDDIGNDLTAGQLPDERCRSFKRVYRTGDIHSLFKMRGGIGPQAMPEGGLTDGDGIEPRALEKDILRIRRDPAVQPAEDPGHRHRFFGIANHEIFRRKLPLLFVERDEAGSLGQTFYDDLPSFDGIQIESMKRLPQLVQNEIGDIDDIADASDTDRL